MYKVLQFPSTIVDGEVESAAWGVGLALWRRVPLLPVPPEPRPGVPGLGEVGLGGGGGMRVGVNFVPSSDTIVVRDISLSLGFCAADEIKGD